MVTLLKNRSGQTVVEYLLLTLFAGLTAVVVLRITGNFTKETVAMISGKLKNVVRNGEVSDGETSPGQQGHPSNDKRFKELHF